MDEMDAFCSLGPVLYSPLSYAVASLPTIKQTAIINSNQLKMGFSPAHSELSFSYCALATESLHQGHTHIHTPESVL